MKKILLCEYNDIYVSTSDMFLYTDYIYIYNYAIKRAACVRD